MGEHPSIWIFSGLAAIIIYSRFRKYRAICCRNISAYHMLCIQIQTGIIRAVDDTLTFYQLEINKISDHTDKNCQKQIGNDQKFQISASFTRFPRSRPHRTVRTRRLAVCLIQIHDLDTLSDPI